MASSKDGDFKVV